MVASAMAPPRLKVCAPMIDICYLKVLAMVYEVNSEGWRPFGTQKNGERDGAGTSLTKVIPNSSDGAEL